jgi:hypothetical protein
MNSELMLDVGQANELKLAFRREGDWDNEKIKVLTERRGFLRQVLDVLEGRAQITPSNSEVISPEGVLTFSMDYSQKLEQMIAAGYYECENEHLWAKLLITNRKSIEKVEAKLFHFDLCMSSEDAKRCIEVDGWEVANIAHLLVFGIKYPKERYDFSIIALGSSCEVRNESAVLCLSKGGSVRRLYLLPQGGSSWASHCRFLAIRKKVS